MAPKRLDEQDIQLRLASLPSWTREGDSLVRQVVCSDFAGALNLVNRIGTLAEKLDHHPDILLHGWNKVRITASTHDAGGLTALDFDLASEIDALG